MRFIFISFLTLLATLGEANAQWDLVHDFEGRNTFIRATYFLHAQSAPHIGFVGLADNWDHVGILYRTSDAGKTWREVGRFEELINEIYFKDQDTGWLVCFDRIPTFNGGCFETNDGGLTWRLLNGTQGGCSAVRYIESENRLLVSRWVLPSLTSTDRVNWTSFAGCTNGFAFFDDRNGVLASVDGSICDGQPYRVTSDGGKTWDLSAGMTAECWQPVIVPEASLILAMDESPTGEVYGSTDKGLTWAKRGKVYEPFRYAGHLVYDGCLLYTQSFTLGISVSSDLGYTWAPLGGPGADYDTRMFQYRDTLYAGDLKARLWVNHNKAYPANRLATHTTATENLTTITLALPSPWPAHGELFIDTDTTLFVLDYNQDEVTLVSETLAKNRRLKRKEVLSPYRTEYVVHRRNPYMENDTNIMDFIFRANVTAKGTGGYVKIRDVRFDSLSPGVECMRLNAPVDSVYIGVPECGDSIISHYLANGIKAIAIKSINPNPTNGSINIDYESKLAGPVTLSVYSVNGVKIHEEVVALASAGKPIQLDASGWSSGAYTSVLRSGEDEARGTVIKQ